jgi:capsular polysaccharide export protein
LQNATAAIANIGHATVLGIRRWKRWQIAPFLTPLLGDDPRARIRFCRTPAAALRTQARHGGSLIVWAAREPDDFAAAAAAQRAPLLRIEDGFLRSVGLGSNHVGGASLVIDPLGIHFDPRQPSQLEQLLQQGDFDAPLLARAARLRHALVGSGVTKYNVGRPGTVPLGGAAGQRRVLVVGQVEDDASVRFGAPQIHSNRALLAAVRGAEPGAWIVYKPHPDTEAGNRRGALADHEALRHADRVVRGVSLTALLPGIDTLHTMTSLAGFEALLRGVAVTAWGAPFYAGWGLTRDRVALPRRTRRCTLDELVAAALISYPRYFDWRRGAACEAEQVAAALAQRSAIPVRPPPWQRPLLWCRGMARSYLGNDPGGGPG